MVPHNILPGIHIYVCTINTCSFTAIHTRFAVSDRPDLSRGVHTYLEGDQGPHCERLEERPCEDEQPLRVGAVRHQGGGTYRLPNNRTKNTCTAQKNSSSSSSSSGSGNKQRQCARGRLLVIIVVSCVTDTK